jgi:VIT1/CCC1 family predicted Fe2+/Mn2+ transporter
MDPDDTTQAIFGGFDGLTSALGLIVATALTGGLKAVVVASVAMAVGAGASMAAGEWLSDRTGNHRRALVMGLATFTGAIMPAAPYFAGLKGPLAYMACGLVAVALGALIAEVRPGPPLRSYLVTFTVLVAASGLAIGTALVAGAAA